MQIRKLLFMECTTIIIYNGHVKFPKITTNEKLELSKYHLERKQTINVLKHRVSNTVP